MKLLSVLEEVQVNRALTLRSIPQQGRYLQSAEEMELMLGSLVAMEVLVEEEMDAAIPVAEV